MVAATSQPNPYDEGYPRSSEATLDPGPDLSESLEDADRVASEEHRVAPAGRREGESTDEENVSRTPMISSTRRLGGR